MEIRKFFVHVPVLKTEAAFQHGVWTRARHFCAQLFARKTAEFDAENIHDFQFIPRARIKYPQEKGWSEVGIQCPDDSLGACGEIRSGKLDVLGDISCLGTACVRGLLQ